MKASSEAENSKGDLSHDTFMLEQASDDKKRIEVDLSKFFLFPHG